MDNSIKKDSPVVSIIVPCYNMEKKIHRLMESLIRQTYKNLQLIFVNDGSVDKTLDVILSYKEKLLLQGLDFHCVTIQNRGLGGAINTGLKLVKGEYFCWPDADDYLTDDSVEKKLRFLESHPEYGIVRSDARLYLEDDLEHPIGTLTGGYKDRFKETDLMEDYILENHALLCPGCHMIRTSSFKEVCPDMDIFEGRGGQNHQLLLPMCYMFKFGYIDECLYNYVIYKSSMTQRYKTFEDLVGKCAEGELYITETLKRIPMPKAEFDYYCELTKQKYIVRRALLAFDFGLKDEYWKERQLVKDARFLPMLNKADCFFKIPCGFFINNMLFKIKLLIKKSSFLYGIIKRMKG